MTTRGISTRLTIYIGPDGRPEIVSYGHEPGFPLGESVIFHAYGSYEVEVPDEDWRLTKGLDALKDDLPPRTWLWRWRWLLPALTIILLLYIMELVNGG